MKPDSQQLLFSKGAALARPGNGRRESLTFKANRNLGRHGWLRLTPAYSRHLVERLTEPLTSNDRVLDPFCGTGTTALTCAEHGIYCDTVDVNPFLIWLANVKLATYSPSDIHAATIFGEKLNPTTGSGTEWRPPIKDIQKWWSEDDLSSLAHILTTIKHADVSESARNLLFSAFCRTAIETAAVSFGHQSMSFKTQVVQPTLAALDYSMSLKNLFVKRLAEIVNAAQVPVRSGLAEAVLGDSRKLDSLPNAKYSYVITSPPYPNRMSYIRELRPYMYWLGFLHDGRQAGELDWKAIGGTWGCATSNLMRWQPDNTANIPGSGFAAMIARISDHSRILSLYVHKYFEDCVLHFRALSRVLTEGAQVHYIVGNSRFYDVMVPTEQIYHDIMINNGFHHVTVENIRKRSSKKELFEFVVSGTFGSTNLMPGAAEAAGAARGSGEMLLGIHSLPCGAGDRGDNQLRNAHAAGHNKGF